MSAVTVDRLELDIQANSKELIASLKSLEDRLYKLKSATKGGLGLKSVANQINTLNASTDNLSHAKANKLKHLSDSILSLSKCKGVSISPTIAREVKEIANATDHLTTDNFNSIYRLTGALKNLGNLGNTNLNTYVNSLSKLPKVLENLESFNSDSVNQKMTEVVKGLSPLTTLGKNNLSSINTQLRKLPQTFRELSTLNMAAFRMQIEAITNVLKPLATEMEKVSRGFSAFPSKLQKVANKSYGFKGSSQLGKMFSVGGVALAANRTGKIIAGFVDKANSYIESLNLFNVSLGEYADRAKEYAEKVSDVMGINPAEWLKNQGVFMTLATGFGVASDRAYTMSKNLTQLGYDLSSFFNIDYQDAFQKLQSGIAGELEPLRRLGYDLSVARLQQEAYTLGIEKKVSAMTQAEKAELRYHAIMTQVTNAQGDMARTLEAPANQLRILRAQLEMCATSLGNIFLPIIQTVLPYLIAFAKVVRTVADAIASLFGFKLPDFSEAFEQGAVGAGGIADNLGEAAKKAKEVKNAMIGIDELNVISPKEDNGGGAGAGVGGGGGLGFELPEYDFIGEATQNRIKELTDRLKEWLGIADGINSWSELFDTRLGRILKNVTAIAAGFAAWQISKSILNIIDKIMALGGLLTEGSFLGGLSFIDDLKKFVDYLEDILVNGANLQNVTGALSEFIGAMGSCFTMMGNLKIGGALHVVQGIGEMFVSISSMLEKGKINWEDALTGVRGLSNIAMGIGLMTKNFKLAAWGTALKGFTTVIEELRKNWDAIKAGDWSQVDKVTLITGGLEMIGGLVVALGAFSKLKDLVHARKSVDAMKDIADTTLELDTTVSSQFSPNLKSLAKNLGLGLVIVGEVAAAAVLITGAIAVMGKELELVGKAWTPVIANGETITTAVVIGSTIIGSIGLAVYGLGTLGKPAAINIGIGTGVLAEVGVAAGLFVIEIWAIGKGLDQIGQAWQPVLDNGETIATGIATGTGLLVAIGLVTAGLGTVTVASAGTLPVAIAIGTGVLAELATAFVFFNESLVKVADELSNRLSPSLANLNEKLPELTTNMSSFVTFMGGFADEVVSYTKHTAISGLSATIDTIVGWFTADPIKKLAKDVEKVVDQTKVLNENLDVAVPELKYAVDMLNSYKYFISEIERITNYDVELTTGMFVNMYEVGQSLITGFVSGIRAKAYDFKSVATEITNGFKENLDLGVATCESSVTTWAVHIKNWFTHREFGGINKATFDGYAKDIILGFDSGISKNYILSRVCIVTWASGLKQWFIGAEHGAINRTTWLGYAKEIVDGFNEGIDAFYSTSVRPANTWANTVKNTFTGIASYQAFYNAASNVIDGFNAGINELYYRTIPYIEAWAESIMDAFMGAFMMASPSKLMKRMGYYVVEGFNIGIHDNIASSVSEVQYWADKVRNAVSAESFSVDMSAITSDVDYIGNTLDKQLQRSYAITSNINRERTTADRSESYLATACELLEIIAGKDFTIDGRVLNEQLNSINKRNGYRLRTT